MENSIFDELFFEKMKKMIIPAKKP